MEEFLALPDRMVRPAVLAAALSLLAIDYLTGPDIRFTILYVVPVAYAAWKWSFSWALGLALVMPLFRLGFAYEWHGLPTVPVMLTNSAIQWATLTATAGLIARMVALQKKVHVLEGILPICSFCKKIRDDDQKWEGIEFYISKRSEARFSHTYCPACMRKHFPEYTSPAAPADE